MVLPAGFELPPLVYLVPLIIVIIAAGWVLWRRRPPVTDQVVLAIVPWMVAGSAAHALYMVDAVPSIIEPFVGTPAVYLTIAALVGVVWAIAEASAAEGRTREPAVYLLAVGLVAAVGSLTGVLWWGLSEELRLFWPSIGLLAAVVLTVFAWLVLDRFFQQTATLAGLTGLVVLFGHALDGVSTAIGIDILEGVERSPIADTIISFGSTLPTSDLIGDTWLFVLVKVAVPLAVLVLFREYLDEEPSQARVLLAVIAAVGLGPGVYNLLLFALPT